MKTKLFQRGPTKKFVSDLQILAAISSAAFKDFAAGMQEAVNRNEEFEQDELLPIASKHNVALEDLMRAYGVASYLFVRQREEGDSLDGLAEDLVTSKTFSTDQAQQVVAKLKEVQSHFAGSVQEVTDRTRDLHMTFPTLDHIHTRCSATVRFDREFSSTKDKPDTYRPVVKRVTPVTVLQMDIDKFGEVETVVVALTKSGVADVINHLQLAMRQLDEFAKHGGAGGT